MRRLESGSELNAVADYARPDPVRKKDLPSTSCQAIVIDISLSYQQGSASDLETLKEYHNA
jgi:hypothetical protein